MANQLNRSSSRDFLYSMEDCSQREFEYHGNHSNRYAASNYAYSEDNYDEPHGSFIKPSRHSAGRSNLFPEEHSSKDTSVHSEKHSRQTAEYHGSSKYMYDTDIQYSANANHQSRRKIESKARSDENESFHLQKKGQQSQYYKFSYNQSPSQFLEVRQYGNHKYASEYPVEYRSKDVSEHNYRHPSNYPCSLREELSPRRYGEGETRFNTSRDSFISPRREVRSEITCENRNISVEKHSRNSLEDMVLVEEFQTISGMIHRRDNSDRYATMGDAKKIAKMVGMKSDQRSGDYESPNHELFSSENIDSEHSHPQKRILWAKQHLNNRSHSLPFARTSSISRKNLFLENSVPSKGKSIWQAKKDKAKSKIKESLKEFFSKLQVWSTSLKFIEGHFGTSVVSYFVFLRWLLFLNLYIFIIFLVFIVLPQVYFPVLQQRKNITTAPTTEVFDPDFISQVLSTRKLLAEYKPRVAPTSYLDLLAKHSSLDSDRLKDLGSLFDTYVGPKFLDVALNYGRTNYTAEVRHNFSEYCYNKYIDMVKQNTSYDIATVIQDFFQGTGWMELTLMFTGHYLPTDLLVSGTGLYYNLSVAFLAVLFALYIICLIMMINYASKGVRENLLSTEVGVQSYCNMVFCGWDYCIENARTANLKHRSILLELKGTLAEVRRQQEVAEWTTLHKAKVYLIRSVVNIFVVASLVGTYYLIYFVAQIQLREQSVPKYQGFSELLIQFLPSITITAVNFMLPVVFDILVRYESYGVQAALNTTLVRIIFVRLASIIILVITFHRQIACEPKDMCFIGKEGCSSPICWETHVGQQMYRLVLMDFFVVIAVTFIWEVPRNFIVQRCKCKLTEMIGRQTFDVPSQVLAIVYGQTLCWLGVFYSPLLPAVCVLKIIIMFYLKKFTLIVNCVPSQISYRASRSNAVFVIVLMLNFFITVAILGYSISNIAPSPACSPFRHLNYMVDAIREALNTWSPYITEVLKYIFSTGFAIATIIFLCLAIYYYLTVTTAHKRMIKVLKSQLVLEGRDKQFLLKRLTEVACEGMAKEN